MPLFLVSLSRIIPLIVALIAIAAIVFIVMFTSKGMNAAKEVLLKLFWWLSIIGCAIFLLFTLYALFDGNQMLTEFFGSCLATMAVCWLIDYLCLRRFRSHHQRDFFIIKGGKSKRS